MLRPIGLLILALAILGACTDPHQASSPTEPSRIEMVDALDQNAVITSDDEWASIARSGISGFAGVYYDKSGQLVILLTDRRHRDAAAEYLQGRISPYGGNGRGAGQVRYELVKYDFAQLNGWADRMLALFASPDVFTIDIDEVNNRVRIGVRNDEVALWVAEEALSAGLPEDAVAAEVIEQPQQYSLTAVTPTLMGGYKIDNIGTDACTFGFNASFNGTPVFVTNSHCTASEFSSPDGSAFYQPVDFAGAVIGTEVADRPPFLCSLAVCRDSDAALIAHNPSSERTIGQGLIARSYRPPWAGAGGVPSIVNTPSYEVVQVPWTPIVIGMVLDKVGAASGQTWGYVEKTCVDVNLPDIPLMFLRCQDATHFAATFGDSGSPVFQILGDGYEVALVGLLWGGSGRDVWHSRISGIQADMAFLGTLTSMCVPGYAC